jgi:hypothetical protein
MTMQKMVETLHSLQRAQESMNSDFDPNGLSHHHTDLDLQILDKIIAATR